MHNQSERGFTLMELLTCLTIVAILSAIAIPQYQAYKARSFDTRANVDLRNVALAEEAYYFDTEHYLSCSNADCESLPGIARLSPGTSLAVEAEESAFLANAYHPQGSGQTYRWDSDEGGMQ